MPWGIPWATNGTIKHPEEKGIMKIASWLTATWLLGLWSVCGLDIAWPAGASAADTLSTEDFLNTLGVNTHLQGLTPADRWNTNINEIGRQLNFIGVRIVRDWIYRPADGQLFKDLQNAWRPDGRFWTSIVEGSPADQRKSLALSQAAYQNFPGLIYAMGGPNEEDDTYPQKLGATLPDAALVQTTLYRWAHPLGLRVSQMEFGAGWTAANGWQGNYNPTNTGSHQNYTPGPADFGAAHTYVSDPLQRMVTVLNMLRKNAQLCTPGKPVAHTEVGAYTHAHLAPRVFGQFLVMGAFDSAAAGDVGYLVYGLQDSQAEATYGFFSFPAGVAHPAARYFHTLTTLLQSTRGSYGPGAKPTFQPEALSASFANKSVSHLVMQKPTGEFVIAVWSEQLMNETAHEESETVDFGRKFAAVSVYDVQEGTAPIAVLHDVGRYTWSLEPSDTYLIELK